MYNRTVKKVTVKGANKFLKKYPESTYAPEVTKLRDSLLFFAIDPEDASGISAFAKDYPDSYYKGKARELIVRHNTSLITGEEALLKAGDCLGAVGWRKDNVEHILALDEGLRLRILSPDGELEEEREISHYTNLESLKDLRLVKPLEIRSIGGSRNYLHFAYLNEAEGVADKEYVEVLYSPDGDILNNAMFYGKALKAAEGESYRIEGQSPESIEGLSNTGEVNWLLKEIGDNPSLVPISKADLLTDNAIKWWREKNPAAETSAKRITFGSLDPDSSLAALYKKHGKERGSRYNAALFDYRGWTVIVAASKSGDSYTLLWCEPQSKNKYRDRFLNSIYFENDGTTLDLNFYKGKSMFKVRLSTANGSVRR